MKTSSKLLEKGAAGTSVIPRCNGIFPAWWRKTSFFYFQGMLSGKLHKEQGSHASKSFQLPEESEMYQDTYCGIRARELLGRDGFQTADIISSVQHCITLDVWEAAAFGTHLSRHWCWVTRNGMWAVSEGRGRRCQKSTKNMSPI